MVTFIGNCSAKLDDKGRVVFPSPLKSLMPPSGDMRFVLKKNLFKDCLDMFTFEEWERQSSEMYGKLNIMFNKDHDSLWSEFWRESAVVKPDEKLGRITIPRKLLGSIGITKEVVFAGCGYKIEIWAEDKYEYERVSHDKLLEIAAKLSENR